MLAAAHPTFAELFREHAPYAGRALRNEVALDEALPATDGTTPHDEAERRQALARLDAALERLDDDKRAVVVLYELEELTRAEVASVVGAPLPTVYSRLQAARKSILTGFGEASAGTEKGKAP